MSLGAVELKPGVWRHYKDGRFYLVLFVARVTQSDLVDAADVELRVWVVPPDTFGVSRGGGYGEGIVSLFTARAHGRLTEGQYCAVYVPLYADKPGRRISVRPVAEFNEMVSVPAEKCQECDDGHWYDPGAGRDHRCDACKGTGIKTPAHSTARFTFIGDEVPQS